MKSAITLFRSWKTWASVVAVVLLVGCGRMALKWTEAEAEKGAADAQCALGFLYQYGDGKGVAQDYAEALKWYRLAADQENATAQRNLGFMYEKGQGVARDYAEAYKWYSLVASTGYQQAVTFRDRVARKMTPQQIVEAERRVAEFKAKHPNAAK